MFLSKVTRGIVRCLWYFIWIRILSSEFKIMSLCNYMALFCVYEIFKDKGNEDGARPVRGN